MEFGFQEIITLLTLIGAGLTGFGAWVSKSYLPYQQRLQEARIDEAARQREHEQKQADQNAEEQRKQREFERELTRAKAVNETSGENNIWQQMVNLQTKLMLQNEEFSSFIISLATERADKSDMLVREDMKDTIQKWMQTTHELREIRASLSVLVQEAARREEERRFLQELPSLILQMINRQEMFYDSVKNILQGGGHVQAGSESF